MSINEKLKIIYHKDITHFNDTNKVELLDFFEKWQTENSDLLKDWKKKYRVYNIPEKETYKFPWIDIPSCPVIFCPIHLDDNMIMLYSKIVYALSTIDITDEPLYFYGVSSKNNEIPLLFSYTNNILNNPFHYNYDEKQKLEQENPNTYIDDIEIYLSHTLENIWHIFDVNFLKEIHVFSPKSFIHLPKEKQDLAWKLYFPGSVYQTPYSHSLPRYNTNYFWDICKKNNWTNKLIYNIEKTHTKNSSVFTHRTNIRKLFFRNTELYNLYSTEFSVPLDVIFYRFSPEKDDAPFINYTKNGQSIFKMNKLALSIHNSYGITEKDLENWTTKDQNMYFYGNKMKKNTTRMNSINIKIYLGLSSQTQKPYFASLVIRENKEYYISFLFGEREFIKKENIENYFIPRVNKVLEKINNLLKDDFIIFPHIPLNIFETKNPHHILFLHTDNALIKNKKAKNVAIEEVKELIKKTHPFVFFLQTQSNKSNIIEFIYRRTNNFSSPENINLFIQKYILTSHIQKKHIDLISHFFDINPDTAKHYLEMNLSYKNDKEYIHPSFLYNFDKNIINVRIIMSVSTYKIDIMNMRNYISNNRIMNFLMFILQNPEEVKNVYQNFALDDKGLSVFPKIDYNIDKIHTQNTRNVNNANAYLNSNTQFYDESLIEQLEEELKNINTIKTNEKIQKKSVSVSSENTQDNAKHLKIPLKTIVNEPFIHVPFKPLPHENKKITENKKVTRDRLEKLKEADEVLFGTESSNPRDKKGETRFSRKCQNDCQPIVISPDELVSIRQKYPGSIPNWVLYGSTPEKTKKNVYFCPDVWCPQSRIAMTYAQYTDKGYQCPNPGEDAIIRNNMNSDKRGFINFYPHPNKEKYSHLCIPHCRIKPPRKKTQECNIKVIEGGLEKAIEDDKKDSTSKSTGKMDKAQFVEKQKKIISATTADLPKDRFGKVPMDILYLLQKNPQENEEYVTNNTKTYLRKGVSSSSSPQKFLECMVDVLEHPHIKNIHDLINSIVEHFKMEDFIFAQYGLLCKKFLPQPIFKKNNEIYDNTEFLRFKKWFLDNKQTTYIKKFHIQHLHTEMMQISTFNGNLSIMKEFILYKGYQNFMKYLQDPHIIKFHDILLSIFTHHNNWIKKMNVRLFNYIVFEMIDETPTFACPYYTSTMEELYNRKRYFIFLYKHDIFYQPLHFVKMIKSKIYNTHKIELNTHISRMIASLYSSCQNNPPSETFIASNYSTMIISVLKKLSENNIKYQVIDFNFNLIGVIIDKDIYIPFHAPSPIKYDLWKTTDCVFIDIMYYTIRPQTNYNDIMTLLKKINNEIKHDYYNYDARKKNDDKFFYTYFLPQDNVAVRNKFIKYYKKEIRFYDIKRNKIFLSQIIPLKPNLYNDIVHSKKYSFIDDLYIFVRAKSPDPRIDTVDMSHAIENTYFALRNETIHLILQEKNKEIYHMLLFLQNTYNPIPINIKRVMLYNIIHPKLINKIVISEGNEEDLFKGFFQDNLCSSITDKLSCHSQCRWRRLPKKNASQNKKTDHFSCMLHIPSTLYNTLMARNMDDILNPMFSLKKNPIENRDYINDNIIIFTRDDIEEGRLNEITHYDMNPYIHQLDIKEKNVPLDIETLFTTPIYNGKSNSFKRILKINNAKKTNTSISITNNNNNSNFGTEEELYKIHKKDRKKLNKEQKRKIKEYRKLTVIPFIGDILVDYKLVPNLDYNPMTIYEIFSSAFNYLYVYHDNDNNNNENKINKKHKKINAYILKDITLNIIKTQFQKNIHNTLQALKEGGSTFEGETWEQYYNWAQSSIGFPSDYEIHIIGQFIEINIVTILRRTEIYHFNVKMLSIVPTSTNIIILVKTKTQIKGHYKYEIVKHNQNFIFHKSDIPPKFKNLIDISLM